MFRFALTMCKGPEGADLRIRSASLKSEREDFKTELVIAGTTIICHDWSKSVKPLLPDSVLAGVHTAYPCFRPMAVQNGAKYVIKILDLNADCSQIDRYTRITSLPGDNWRQSLTFVSYFYPTCLYPAPWTRGNMVNLS